MKTSMSIDAFRELVNSPMFERLVASTRKQKTPTHPVQGVGQIGQRGRPPFVYIPTKTDAQLRNVSDPVKVVWSTVAQHPNGLTVKALQDLLKTVPYSTIWFALNKLKQRHLVRVEVLPLAA